MTATCAHQKRLSPRPYKRIAARTHSHAVSQNGRHESGIYPTFMFHILIGNILLIPFEFGFSANTWMKSKP